MQVKQWEPTEQFWSDPRVTVELPPVGRIRLRLEELARSRGVVIDSGPFAGRPNISAIVRGSGLSYTTVQPMFKHPDKTKMISLETIARFCEFFRCTPGELFEYTPASEMPQTAISDQYKREGGREW